MTSSNTRGVDSLVEEYLVHRGFTQSFRVFQKEKNKDRTHGFHAIKIVEQIYFYIENFQINDFIDLWDFLNKRFFMHLDQENLLQLDNIKSDLIKLYLVTLVTRNEKKKMDEFFKSFSHEIIASSGNSAQQLRSWYAIPYMTDPDKDPEFGPYFNKKWSDMLRTTLHNFLSTILLNTPSPKLILLERWFRSDAQEEIRRHLRELRNKLSEHLHRENVYEDRIVTLQGAIKDLVKHIHALNMKAVSLPGTSSDSSLPIHVYPSQNRGSDVSTTLTDSGRHEILYRESINVSEFEKVTTLGNSVCDLATSCVQHSHLSSTHHHDDHAIDHSKNCKTQSKLNQIIEVELLTKIQEWLEVCTITAEN